MALESEAPLLSLSLLALARLGPDPLRRAERHARPLKLERGEESASLGAQRRWDGER